MKQTLIFVLYDGIQNSVFQGQVLKPLTDKLKNNKYKEIILISFEKNTLSKKEIEHHIGEHHHAGHLYIVMLKSYPFLGKLSLYPAVKQLKKILNLLPSYDLIARGPFAGWLCKKAINKKKCTAFTVQARGLLAEEYKYTNDKEKNIFKRLVHWIRAYQFFSLECTIYGDKAIYTESVSPALANYLVKTYKANPNKISIASHDIPASIKPARVASWKKETRKELTISTNSHVYCFNGSAKPWQCPEKVIKFFKKELIKNKKSFLLVLTQNVQAFQKLAQADKLPQNSYKFLTVPHKEIYKYLSACDVGLLFRESNTVNWVSRPTKILEYRAVGLEIIHNNTVAWLANE